MLHVIFTILKILGIIIAIILGLLLLIILSVLFVPLRYKVKAKKYEKITGIIRLHWLLHIVSAYIDYTNAELSYKIKICGFTIINSLKVDSIDETKRDKKHRKQKKVKPDNRDNHIIEEDIYTVNDDSDFTVQAQSIGDSDIKSDTDSEVSKKTKENNP